MATIRDVAKLANVSVATVSRVFNDNGYVNEQTRAKVEQAIRQLDYVPNEVARSLFKGKSKMIALFVPDIMNPFFPELARAVEDIANQNGYTFILCNTDNQKEKEMAYLHALRQKSIDGIIIVSNALTNEQVRKMQMPLIALDRKPTPELTSITVNNRTGAKAAVRYLRAAGCQTIAHIRGPENVSSATERLEGYLEEVKNETWFSDDFIRSGHYTFEDAYQETKELLQQYPHIDGIFAGNDVMGVGTIKAAEDLHIKIPDDLAVIGFDGIELGKTTTPALTTMAQPIYRLGARSAELLIQKIEDPKTALQSEAHDVSLVERSSVKKGSE